MCTLVPGNVHFPARMGASGPGRAGLFIFGRYRVVIGYDVKVRSMMFI